MKGLSHANIETTIRRDGKRLPWRAGVPGFLAVHAVFTRSARALHDLRGANIEREGRGQYDANRLAAAVGEMNGMAHTLAVKKHIGSGGDAGGV